MRKPYVSRREFFKLAGTAAAVVALPGSHGESPELSSSDSEQLLTDDRLEESGIQLAEFDYEWQIDENTHKRLTKAEKEGSQQPKIEQLVGSNGVR